MVESVLLRKIDGLSIQVFSEEYNVVGQDLLDEASLLNLSAFEFVYKEGLVIRHHQGPS